MGMKRVITALYTGQGRLIMINSGSMFFPEGKLRRKANVMNTLAVNAKFHSLKFNPTNH